MEQATDFDVTALFEALDAQRRERGLSWQGVAKELREQSAVLNAWRNDHPISAATVTGMPKRRDTSCQHALFMLRWPGRTPESFVRGASDDGTRTALPPAGSHQRLRRDLQKLYEALDAQRRERGLTWAQLAAELRCSENQLSGIKRARFAMSMRVAMRVVRWLERPAGDFVYAAIW